MSLHLESILKESQHAKTEEQLEREAQLILMRYKFNEPVTNSNRKNRQILITIGVGSIALGLIGYLLLKGFVDSHNPLSVLPLCLVTGGAALMKVCYISSLNIFSQK